MERGVPYADGAGVVPLGLDHVVDHLVAVAATAARTLAQLLGRFDGQAVELLPARAEQPDLPVGLGGGKAPAIGRGMTTEGAPKAVVASPGSCSTTSRVSPAAVLNRTRASRATTA